MLLLLLSKILTERTDENDRKRKATVTGTAPNGGSAGQGSCEGTKGPDTAAHPGGCHFGEGLSRCGDDGA